LAAPGGADLPARSGNEGLQHIIFPQHLMGLLVFNSRNL
jgi:hypothetical protein